MAKFKTTVITTKGQNLINKTASGMLTMEFTKMRTSDADVPDNQLEELTALISVQQELDINAVDIIDDTHVNVKGIISNEGLDNGYNLKLIGLYATDPDDGEILYSVTKAENYDYMPEDDVNNVFSVIVEILTTISNKDAVEINISPSLYATLNDIDNIDNDIDVVDSKIDIHKNKSVNSEEGTHGIRFYEDQLEYWDGDDWVEIETGGSGVPPGNVSGLDVQEGNSKLYIKWSDPYDTPNSIWEGTMLIRKVGSYPTSITDGYQVVDNKIRDQFKDNPVIDTGLVIGTTYYYQAFPYSNKGAINSDIGNRITGVPNQYGIFGVRIDTTNNNPETSVSYTDDAVGMTAGSVTWNNTSIFKDIKPCLLKNGVVQYYLNPGDYTQKATGGAADITSGNDGDVMIEIPKMGYKFNQVGNYLDIKITNQPNNPNFCYHAFTRTTTGDKSKLYIGAYLGWKDGSNKIRSLSGKTPTVDIKIGDSRTYAQNNGSGYDILSFYPLTLLQCLYLIKYKNLDSQTALGRGYVDGNSSSISTGGTNTKGMYYGENTGKLQMKFAGIEDFWGNLRYWIDGLYCDNNYNIMTAYKNFNDTGTGYLNQGQGVTADIYGYIKKVQGTNDTGFIIKENGGADNQYYCDQGYLIKDCLGYFGGSWNNESNAGVFWLYVARSSSSANYNLGVRSMFL